jgi:hypothetical protein
MNVCNIQYEVMHTKELHPPTTELLEAGGATAEEIFST